MCIRKKRMIQDECSFHISDVPCTCQDLQAATAQSFLVHSRLQPFHRRRVPQCEGLLQVLPRWARYCPFLTCSWTACKGSLPASARSVPARGRSPLPGGGGCEDIPLWSERYWWQTFWQELTVECLHSYSALRIEVAKVDNAPTACLTESPSSSLRQIKAEDAYCYAMRLRWYGPS